MLPASDTPAERAIEDYATGFEQVYAAASYVTINISSPNTRGLRSLQESQQLDALLAAICTDRNALANSHGKRVPLALKIAPDLDSSQVSAVADLVTKHGIDAVIATNTTIARDNVAGVRHADETGGLSGAPLTASQAPPGPAASCCPTSRTSGTSSPGSMGPVRWSAS